MSEHTVPEAGAGAWPWSALGLDAAAPAGQIRKAYAKALKAIDQQRDVPGFQALREARDEALALAMEGGELPLADRSQNGDQASRRHPPAAGDGGGGTIFLQLKEFLDNPWARISLASWERMLDERPLMTRSQASAYERRVVLALDGWLDREILPAHEVFLLLDSIFGWSTTESRLGDFLPRMRERRLRTIIGSLRA